LVREPRQLRDSYSQTLAIGRLVGRQRAAKELVKKTKARVARARRDVEERPRVMVILGVGRTPFVFLPTAGAATSSARREGSC
jgi:ABC-type Fe3+-hydroxamate transport system substrate-binding protein